MLECLYYNDVQLEYLAFVRFQGRREAGGVFGAALFRRERGSLRTAECFGRFRSMEQYVESRTTGGKELRQTPLRPTKKKKHTGAPPTKAVAVLSVAVWFSVPLW